LPAHSVTLSRRLSTTSAALFGLSYICPVVIVSTFGVIATKSRGATALAYLIATIAMVLTAASYGRMAARYQEAGSAYTYVSRSANPVAGLFVGWILMLDYFFIPMVICLITAQACEALLPSISHRAWLPIIAAFATGVNLLGIKIADRVNLAIMAAQLLGMAALGIVCVLFLKHGPMPSSHEVGSFSLPAVLGGAAVACYSFLGFDAVATLAEETHDPARSIPRATVLAAGAAGLIFIVIAYLMGEVHPALDFSDVDNAGFEVLRQAAGPAFNVIFGVILIVSNLAAAMCAQAGSSRLLYVMGRSGVLPRRFFGYLHPRYRTPSYGIAAMGALMLAGYFFDIETATTCVNFGAFTAFVAVNLCVLGDHFGARRQLGGGVGKLIVAGLGAAASAALLVNLGHMALTVGMSWLAIGFMYIVYLTGVFRKPLPVMDSAQVPEKGF